MKWVYVRGTYAVYVSTKELVLLLFGITPLLKIYPVSVFVYWCRVPNIFHLVCSLQDLHCDTSISALHVSDMWSSNTQDKTSGDDQVCNYIR